MKSRERGCRPQSSCSEGRVSCTSDKASWLLMLRKTGSGAGGSLSGARGAAGPCAGSKDWDGGVLARGGCREWDGDGRVADCGRDWGGGDLAGGRISGPDGSVRL